MNTSRLMLLFTLCFLGSANIANAFKKDLTYDCGQFSLDRIGTQDGAPTDLYAFPWLALLEYETGAGKQFGCGGVLISDRYVLTAASCLQQSGDLVSVRLGEHNLNTDPDCYYDDPEISLTPICKNKFIEVGIESTIAHDKYTNLRGPSDFDELNYDIALIRLNRSVELNDLVKPICLPGQDLKHSLYGKYMASGWGTRPDMRPESAVKKMFRLTFTRKNACENVYGYNLKKDVMCATAQKSNVGCYGDFGGPLMTMDGEYRMTVVGVYSPLGNHETCSSTAYPNTYTDVSKYRDWIVSNMKA